MLVLRGLVGSLLQILMIGVLLIGPAGLIDGNWGWPRGWAFLMFYGTMLFPATVGLAMFAPASLEARLKAPASPDQSPGDKAATSLIVGGLCLFIMFLPLDVLKWQLLGTASDLTAWFGLLICAAGYGFVIWVIVENSFAIPIVEDQSDRQQTVVTSGPYRIVRHPMYLGILVMFGGMGLFVQSLASLLLIPVLALCFVPRIRIEEGTLKDTLEGYEAFMAQQPNRLVPGLW